jgi:hypothetical protein
MIKCGDTYYVNDQQHDTCQGNDREFSYFVCGTAGIRKVLRLAVMLVFKRVPRIFARYEAATACLSCWNPPPLPRFKFFKIKLHRLTSKTIQLLFPKVRALVLTRNQNSAAGISRYYYPHHFDVLVYMYSFYTTKRTSGRRGLFQSNSENT